MNLFLITQPEEGKIDHKYIKSLSDEDFQEYQSAWRVITEHDWFVAMINMVVDNLDELADQITIEAKNMASRSWLDEADIRLIVTLNCRLMNYLISWRFCVDQIHKTIKSEFGDKSSQYRSLNAMTRKIYDRSFAYRFIYNLRNYISHAALPINGFNISYENEGLVPHLYMDASALLEGTDKWQSKVKKDLAEMDRLDVYSLAYEAYLELRDLSIESSTELLRGVFHACMTMCSIFGKYLLEPGRLVVGEVLEESDQPKGLQFRDIPLKRLEEFGLLKMLRDGTTFIRPTLVQYVDNNEPN